MQTSACWKFGPFEFNAVTFRLERDGTVIALEPKAQDVLRLLLDRAPATVEKSEIFSVVWKDVAVSDNALTRVIAQIRKALEDDAKNPRYVETVATRGYRMVPAVHRVAALPPDPGVPIAVQPAASIQVPAGAEPAVAARTTAPAAHVSARPLVTRGRAAAIVLLALAALALLARPLFWGTSAALLGANDTTADGPDMATYARLRPVQLTTGLGVDTNAAFSFDGTSVAYTSDRTGTFEIYVQMLVPGAASTPLTSNGRQNVQPAWSPDGQFIAFHEVEGNGIWIVPSRGGTARRISETGSRPSWSPDGRWIAFQSSGATDITMLTAPTELSSISIVDPKTGEVRAVTRSRTPPGPHVSPQWSADGRRLYFAEAPLPYTSGHDTAQTALWSVALDGSDMRREAASPQVIPEYAVVPDGSIAWVIAGPVTGLWWQPLGSGQTVVDPRPAGIPTVGRPTQPVLSRDGRVLAWTGMNARSTLWAVPVPTNPDAPMQPAAPVSLGAGLRVTGAAARPDGRLAYSGTVQGNVPQIWTRDPNGAVRQITVDDGDHLIPFWLEGYRELAYFSRHKGVPAFTAVDVETGQERQLFALADLPSPAGTAPHPLDNLNVLPNVALSRVVMTRLTDGVPNLWVVPLEGGRPHGSATQVTFEKDGGSFPHWSPDGRWITYQCDEGEDTHVCIVGADGKERRLLTQDHGLNFIGGWMGTGTVLVAARRNSVWNVVGVDVNTGAVRRFTSFSDARSYVRYPQWDAAGKRILFERAEVTANVWRVNLPR